MTPMIVQISTSGTFTVAATKDETQTATAALLSLGTDLPPLDIDYDENAALVPLVPPVPTLGLIPPKAADVQTVPLVIGTAVKKETKTEKLDDATNNGQKKRKIVTLEYKLKRKYVKTKRKFPCSRCQKVFTSQREVNDNFRMTHPPVKCDICKQTFDTPAAMMKHKYVHYEYMNKFKYCRKGFHFESQLREHLHVHHSQGDWTCFKLKCRKRFKCESELNAHLIAHNKQESKCDQCTYSTQILKTSECTNVNIVIGNHSCVHCTAKDSSGCNKDIDILSLKSPKTRMLRNKLVNIDIVLIYTVV